MVKSFTATVERWVLETEGALDDVVSTATTHMLADIPIKAGMVRSGSYAPKGSIPRDQSFIANSLQSSLYGSTVLTPPAGEESYVLVAGQMKAGDVATFLWGGSLAPHARAMHYGYTTSTGKNVPGTFWIDVAANKWQGYVDAAAAKAKAGITG